MIRKTTVLLYPIESDSKLQVQPFGYRFSGRFITSKSLMYVMSEKWRGDHLSVRKDAELLRYLASINSVLSDTLLKYVSKI